jgi:Leucine-rich repeat (LRR) protein
MSPGFYSGNRLTQLPSSIGDLEALRILRLDSNRLVKLPPSFAYLPNQLAVEFANNPTLVSPPLVVCKQGIPAIRDYIKRHELAQDMARHQRLQAVHERAKELKVMQKEADRMRRQLAEDQQKSIATEAELDHINPAFNSQRDHTSSGDISTTESDTESNDDTQSTSSEDEKPTPSANVKRSGRSVTLLPSGRGTI